MFGPYSVTRPLPGKLPFLWEKREGFYGMTITHTFHGHYAVRISYKYDNVLEKSVYRMR